jgi:hypothetical protein
LVPSGVFVCLSVGDSTSKHAGCTPERSVGRHEACRGMARCVATGFYDLIGSYAFRFVLLSFWTGEGAQGEGCRQESRQKGGQDFYDFYRSIENTQPKREPRPGVWGVSPRKELKMWFCTGVRSSPQKEGIRRVDACLVARFFFYWSTSSRL